jgi:hypothetical protein
MLAKTRGTVVDSDVTCNDSDVTSDGDDDVVNRQAERAYMAATWWTLDWWGRPLKLTFKGCDFNFIFAMRLWSLAGALHAPFFVGGGGGAGGFAGSQVPMAAWLNPHSSEFFNIQFRRQELISRYVAMGMSEERRNSVFAVPCGASPAAHLCAHSTGSSE